MANVGRSWPSVGQCLANVRQMLANPDQHVASLSHEMTPPPSVSVSPMIRALTPVSVSPMIVALTPLHTFHSAPTIDKFTASHANTDCCSTAPRSSSRRNWRKRPSTSGSCRPSCPTRWRSTSFTRPTQAIDRSPQFRTYQRMFIFRDIRGSAPGLPNGFGHLPVRHSLALSRIGLHTQ